MKPPLTHSVRWLLALLLAFGVASVVHAQEQIYVHVVHTGETLASIAQAYYGDPRRQAVIRAENGLSEHELPLCEGMRLTIPVVRYHRVTAGESWRSLAERYYGDPSRASTLLRANRSIHSATPDEGVQLLIPYPIRHIVRNATESLASIAARYYTDREEARALRAFNGGHTRASHGQVVLVPLSDLTLSRQGESRVDSELFAPPNNAERARLQAEVVRDISRLREHVQNGRYVEATALGNHLLGRGQLTGNQEISIQRELATSYVALGRTDLAIDAFSRALEKQPDLELDSLRTSPRVLAALEAAKQQRAR